MNLNAESNALFISFNMIYNLSEMKERIRKPKSKGNP